MKLRRFMPHQKEAFEKFKDLPNMALFMEMRLGKSMVAIRWAKQFNDNILIVAPLSTLNDWERELHLEKCNPIVWLTGKEKQKPQPYGWHLVNYERLRSDSNILYREWGVIIADESTKIKNPKAQITKLLHTRVDCDYRAILSGLPAPEDPIDFFCQMKFLNGNFIGYDNYWTFRHRYFHQDWSGYGWDPNKGTKKLIKKEIHRLGYVITRKQAGIGSKKLYSRRFVGMTKPQEKMYDKVVKEFAFTDTTKKEIQTKWAMVQSLWLARIAGGFSPALEKLSKNKNKELSQLLCVELRNEKVVVWFRFNRELRSVRAMLKSRKEKVSSITGNTLLKKRKTQTEWFRKPNGSRIMLCQIKCFKYGIDLSCASTAIYFSNDYSMENRAQSEDRIIHPKKKEPILYIDLITRGSIDEDVIDMLVDKKIDARYFMRELLDRTLRRFKK